MKRFISILVAAMMIAAMIPAIVNAAADEDDYVSPGNIIVPYTSGDNITIDGTLNDGEWSETNRLVLTASKNFLSWAGFPEYRGQIDFYYSWGDKGLYMAAIVLDDTLEDGIGYGNLATRFQIALNPAAIIDEDYNGLFFSITPEDETDTVHLYRHNWESGSVDGGYDATEEGFEGKYTFKKDGDDIIGWNLECMIPWDMIATADREEELDVDDSIPLTSFNPKDENRKRAFCTATICYVQCNTPDGGLETLGRTATDGDPNDFSTASYDIVLLFALPGETDRSTETEYFTAGSAPETDAATEAETAAETEAETEAEGETATETEAEGETAAETEAEGETAAETEGAGETAAETEAEGETAAETDAEGKAVTEAETEKTGDESNNKTGLIIAIVIGVVVAAAAVVVALVLKNKKKA